MWKDDESQPTEVRIVRVLDNLHFNLGMLVGLFAKLQKETQDIRDENQALYISNQKLQENNDQLFAYNQKFQEWNEAEWGPSVPESPDDIEASWPEIQEAREEGK